MSTKTLMSVEEYLRTSFDGADRECLDGDVVERNLGNKSHGRLQLQLAPLLKEHEGRTGIYVVVEVRQRVSDTRFRIPDVAVFEGEPVGEVPSIQPLVAIEILSPDDKVGYVIPKLREYWSWGVRHIWVADPEDRKLFAYGETGLHETTELRLQEHGIILSSTDIFRRGLLAFRLACINFIYPAVYSPLNTVVARAAPLLHLKTRRRPGLRRLHGSPRQCACRADYQNRAVHGGRE
jgi:Uma2 family endonuclease